MRFIASSDKELCRRKRAEEHGERVAWNTVQYHESKQNRQKSSEPCVVYQRRHFESNRFMNRGFIMRALGSGQTGTAIRQ